MVIERQRILKAKTLKSALDYLELIIEETNEFPYRLDKIDQHNLAILNDTLRTMATDTLKM